jgi:hypothetical protein
MNVFKKWLPDVLVVLLFVVIGYAYFFPADIEGRILYRHDSSAGVGSGQEMAQYQQRTGERTRWTNALFSGMPTYQMAPSYNSTDTLSTAVKAYHLWLPENVWFLFVYLLGFYILLRAFDFRWYLAALGSIMWAFSTYFLIIIAAGHIWKVWALAYLPPMIAGIVLAYRGKFLAGLLLTAIFAAFEVNANHVQMTYYYLFVILFMIIAFLVEAIQQRQIARFLKATGVCIVGGAIGILINISNLYHTWEYGKETMRGKSELVKENTGNQTSSGLERDYITQWSYGIGETWTLLVPNTKGGASQPLAANKTAMAHADNNFISIYQQMGQYWGEQPGTQGPVYVGAFVLFLFVLGLFIVKGPMKWALFAATVLSIMLSWGKNFMGLTDFFIDYVPIYAKFRTVASILVIAEFTIPLLAMLALKKLLDEPEQIRPRMKYIGISFLLTGGVALLFWLMPSMFFNSFISSSEMQALQSLPTEYIQPLVANLTEMRQAMFTADSMRSFYIILVGTGVLLSVVLGKLKKEYGVGIILVLCLVDLWTVNKRYLHDGMFVDKIEREQKQPMTETDQIILKDKSLDYRVLNLASNTFNENETSYYHKSVGGYHAAKLRRYQELIEAHIAPEMQAAFKAIADAGGEMAQVPGDSVYPVLNMLNAKYFILPMQSGKTIPVENPYVYGNAWFVNDVKFVDSANAELDALGKLDLRHVAVADAKFREQLKPVAGASDSLSVVNITAYEPNRLSYDVKSDKGGVIVFSEVYYPGWTATVDGESVEIGRVNYVLRAITVQPGNHKVELMFYPKSLDITETIAYVSIGFLFVIIILTVFLSFRRKRS